MIQKRKNRIAISGSKFVDEKDEGLIKRMYRIVQNLDLEDTEIISGVDKGTEKLGEYFAELYDIPCLRIGYDWDSWGAQAPFFRNKKIVDSSTHLIVIGGVKDAVIRNLRRLALSKGIKVRFLGLK